MPLSLSWLCGWLQVVDTLQFVAKTQSENKVDAAVTPLVVPSPLAPLFVPSVAPSLAAVTIGNRPQHSSRNSRLASSRLVLVLVLSPFELPACLWLSCQRCQSVLCELAGHIQPMAMHICSHVYLPLPSVLLRFSPLWWHYKFKSLNVIRRLFNELSGGNLPKGEIT